MEEINLKYAKEHGIQVVRRMSGGGTIYTDMGGWEFSFIEYGDTSSIHFKEYISPVIEALHSLNVPAEFNGRNDLLIKGRKFSGNAQYKLAGNTVHHGSILFDTDIEQMVKSTTVDEYKIISKSIKSVRERVTNVKEHLEKPMSAEEFKEHMTAFIMQGDTKRYELTEEDIRVSQQIADEKFRSWESCFGSDPKSSLTKTGRFKGGKIVFHLDVKKGRILTAKVEGDFFGTEQAEHLPEALAGCRLDKTELVEALKKAGMENAIYGISVEEMAETMTE
jgi:lipoate-protein ligase A